ncbi:MAG: class I SAM-dependent methyltransferase [Candidatus Latescibacteria bacterium]|nr:class I SAM-dependent methyltransferase [Candidatus Latescibacterota bacterium]
MSNWYNACNKTASLIRNTIPSQYHSRTFSGIIGDIKVLSSKKAQSLFNRKKGLGNQYAYLYLTQGIDYGRGYQACAVEALRDVLGHGLNKILSGNILDVGCSVGVTAGVLSFNQIVGFDLFPDLLKTAKLVDSINRTQNYYVAADMTHDWPFERVFDSVVCGMVCHHLKEQVDVITFFRNVNRVLYRGGSLIITLPAGSICTTVQLEHVMSAVENFGFKTDRKLSGLVRSTDDSRSLFWMFQIIAEKITDKTGNMFISSDFGFQQYRTPETREEKGDKARTTIKSVRCMKHNSFELIGIDEMHRLFREKNLVFPVLSACFFIP